MNWPAARNLDAMGIGTVLAFLILAAQPNFGLSYALSPAVPSAVLAFMGMAWMARRRRNWFDSSPQRRWAVLVLLLLVPIVISLPASYLPKLSASIAAVLIIYYFAGAALIHVLGDDGRRAWVIRWTSWVLLAWLVDSVVQQVAGRDLFGIALTPDGRVTGPFFGNLRQGMFLAMLLPLAVGFFKAQKRGWIWALVFFVAATAVAVLSGVRMILVMLTVATMAVLIHLPRSRWKLLAFAVVLAAASASVLWSPVLRERLVGQLERVQTLDFETLDRLTTQRLTIWHTASNMLVARPLNGVGAGAFEKAYGDFATREHDMFRDRNIRVHHAHQVYVAFAAETGWPGLLALLAAVGLCIRWYWSAPAPRRQAAWPFAIALAVYFFPVNTQPPFFNQWLFPALVLLTAAMLAALAGRDDGDDDPSGRPGNSVAQKV